MPDLSILCPTVRVHNWKEIIENISKNKVETELIFVGPFDPIIELPKNVKHIKTANIKPVQCIEIAFRASTSPLFMFLADDVLVQGNNPLDILVNKYYEINDEKTFVSGIYAGNSGVPAPQDHFVMTVADPKPLVCMGVHNRRFVSEIGCIDKNFMAIWFDIDMDLRARLVGGTVVLCDGAYMQELIRLSGETGTFFTSRGKHDVDLLHRLWRLKDPNYACKERTAPFEPFSDENILLKSQGPTGVWE